jgi:CRISPR/Cas system endoribonuclease Cas6 (RAMP superfamily)
MAKYDVEFKKKCIKAYEEKKELPKVDGVMPKSMARYVREWLMLFKEQGEKGLLYTNYRCDIGTTFKHQALLRTISDTWTRYA